MNKMRIFLLFLLVLISKQLIASDFGISLGINHSWLVYKAIPNIDNEFNPGYSIGLSNTLSIEQNLYFSYGIRFFNIGRYDEIEFNNYKEKVHLNHIYISFPVKFGYRIFKKLEPFVNVEPGLQIKSYYYYKNSASVVEETKTITDEMNRFNLFVGFGLKYFLIIKNQKFGISGLINYGLIRVSKDEKYDVTENSSRSWAEWETREILLNFEYYF